MECPGCGTEIEGVSQAEYQELKDKYVKLLGIVINILNSKDEIAEFLDKETE